MTLRCALVLVLALGVLGLGGASALQALNYQQGRQYEYDYKTEQTTYGTSHHGVQTSNVVITSKAIVQVLSLLDDGSFLCALVLRGVHMRSNGGGVDPALDGAFGADLERFTVNFHLNTHGEISEISYKLEEPAYSVNIKRGVLTALQTQLYVDGKHARNYAQETAPHQVRYGGNEVDVTGDCPVAYTMETIDAPGEGSFTKISKEKLMHACSVRPIRVKSRAAQRRHVDESHVVSSLRAEHILDRDTGIVMQARFAEEHRIRSLDNSPGRLHSASQGSLVYVRDSRLPFDLRVSLEAGASSKRGLRDLNKDYQVSSLMMDLTQDQGHYLDKRGVRSPTAGEEQQHEQQYDTMAAEILSQIEMYNKTRDLFVFRKIINAIKHDNDQQAILGRLYPYIMDERRYDSVFRYTVAAVFASLSSPDSFSFLYQALTDPTSSTALQMQVMMLMNHMLEVDEGMIEQMYEYSTTLNTTKTIHQALLTLGSMIHNFGDPLTDKVERVFQRILARLHTSRSSVETVIILRALANAGQVSAVPSIKRIILSSPMDDDHNVHRAAIHSLRKLDHAVVQEATGIDMRTVLWQTLEDWSIRDSVRMVAFTGLFQNEKSPASDDDLERLINLLADEPSRPVYMEIVEKLRLTAPSSPQVYRILLKEANTTNVWEDPRLVDQDRFQWTFAHEQMRRVMKKRTLFEEIMNEKIGPIDFQLGFCKGKEQSFGTKVTYCPYPPPSMLVLLMPY
eukprot:TRINITY_DN7756_c0_g1_i3.p1 TRINITY_DN7756_c0_g1~~TRINITY_DN7756_c0_g1_i3.p1  ORF type:complete len:736 (+),score=215.88 TRINITY_DN7756_c0_g1_i3:236-2443(+)